MQSKPVTGLVLLLAFFLLSAMSTLASDINFDDIFDGGSGSQLPNGYASLDWSNFGAINTALLFDFTGINGYINGTVSPPNVAFNFGGTPASFSGEDLTFGSAYFTGAWRNDLTIAVTGYKAGIAVDFTSFVVDATSPTLETFNWAGIDEVEFDSSGGISAGFPNPGDGTEFAMDNLNVNIATTPEPRTLNLAVVGLLAFLALRRRPSI